MNAFIRVTLIGTLCAGLLAAGCQRASQREPETIIRVEDVAVNEEARHARDDAPAPAESYDPQQPVGYPDDLPERQLGRYLTVIPAGATTDPGGNPLDPSVIEILEKLEGGAELSTDEETTFLATDAKFRNYDEIKDAGERQADN